MFSWFQMLFQTFYQWLWLPGWLTLPNGMWVIDGVVWLAACYFWVVALAERKVRRYWGSLEDFRDTLEATSAHFARSRRWTYEKEEEQRRRDVKSDSYKESITTLWRQIDTHEQRGFWPERIVAWHHRYRRGKTKHLLKLWRGEIRKRAELLDDDDL